MLVIDTSPPGRSFIGTINNHRNFDTPFFGASAFDFCSNVRGKVGQHRFKFSLGLNVLICAIRDHDPFISPLRLALVKLSGKAGIRRVQDVDEFIISGAGFFEAVGHHFIFRAPFGRASCFHNICVVCRIFSKCSGGGKVKQACKSKGFHGLFSLHSIFLINAPLQARVNPRQKKTVVGFRSLSVYRRSKTALNKSGFLMSRAQWETARSADPDRSVYEPVVSLGTRFVAAPEVNLTYRRSLMASQQAYLTYSQILRLLTCIVTLPIGPRREIFFQFLLNSNAPEVIVNLLDEGGAG